MTPVIRAAEAVCRRLQEQSPQRLPELYRSIGPHNRPHFEEGCALAIIRGWAVRADRESLTLGDRFMGERRATRGIRGANMQADRIESILQREGYGDDPRHALASDCPACGARSFYSWSTDRFIHEDGSANRDCWRRMTSGKAPGVS